MPGHNNWFRTSLNNPLENFKVEFKPYPFRLDTFYNNAVKTLKLINEKYDNLYLGLSGGLDSEFVMKIAMENDIKITPVIVISPFNTIERDYAIYFCKTNQIKFEIFNLDEKTFIEAMIKKIYNRNFHNYFNALNLCLADFVKSKGGVLLTGFGDPFEVLSYPTNMSEVITFAEWDFYLDYYDSDHPNCFFTYTPELLYSFINEIDYNLPLQEAKANLYKLNFRPKIDYSPVIVKKIFSSLPTINNNLHYFKIEKTTILKQFSKYIQN